VSESFEPDGPPETSADNIGVATAEPPVSLGGSTSAVSLDRDVPRGQIAMEIAVVMLLSVVPNLFQSGMSFWMHESGAEVWGFSSLMLQGIFSSAQVVAPVLYIIWRGGEGWTPFGMPSFRWTDAATGAGLYVVYFLIYYAAWIAIYRIFGTELLNAISSDAADRSPFTGPTTRLHLILLVAGSLANGFCEELVVRAYLFRRIGQLGGNGLAALLITTILFAGYHLYQGWAGVINALVCGLVFGVAYLIWRRLWIVAIAHAVADFMAFLMMT
jgi:membrane protease YdiL (CAAX protease family)